MPKPQSHITVATLLFVVIVTVYLILAVYFPPAYIFATYEDLIGEWMQWFGFLVTLLFAFVIAVRPGRHRWFFALLAVACVYTLMEEISWGQRLFGFATPGILLEHNQQGEANLHNLLTGPVSTTGKIISQYLLAVALVGYGLVYPLALRSQRSLARWLDLRGIAAPPLFLWPYFVTAALLETDMLDFNEAEVAELLVAVALALQAVHYQLSVSAGRSAYVPLPRAASRQLGWAMMSVVAAIGLLSAATTYALYSSADSRQSLQNRLSNGYEKFAGRYAAYGRWDAAALLYVRVQTREPDNTYYLTRIAEAFGKAGNRVLFGVYHRRAFAEGQHDLAEQPRDVRANLAMAHLYRQAGETTKALELERRANRFALEDLRANPRSAAHAYWAARTFRQLGDHAAAREHFRRAAELAPTSLHYRRTYLEMAASPGGG